MSRIPQKGRKARWEPLRSIASSAVTASYAIVGTVTTNPAQIVVIINNATTDVTVSFDGVNDMDYIPHGTVREYNLGSATQDTPNMECMELPANTGVYVKGTAGTGNIYVIIIYQSEV